MLWIHEGFTAPLFSSQSRDLCYGSASGADHCHCLPSDHLTIICILWPSTQMHSGNSPGVEISVKCWSESISTLLKPVLTVWWTVCSDACGNDVNDLCDSLVLSGLFDDTSACRISLKPLRESVISQDQVTQESCWSSCLSVGKLCPTAQPGFHQTLGQIPTIWKMSTIVRIPKIKKLHRIDKVLHHFWEVILRRF